MLSDHAVVDEPDESSRVVCTIDAPPGVKALPLELLADKVHRAPAFGQLVGRLPSQRDQAAVSSVVPVGPAPGQASPVAPIVPLARVEVAETLGKPGGDVAANAVHEGVVDVPMATTTFLQNIFAEPTLVVDPSKFKHIGASPAATVHSGASGLIHEIGEASPTVGGATAAKSAPVEAKPAGGVSAAGGLAGASAGGGALDLSLRFADTLALSNGICVQLYGGSDDVWLRGIPSALRAG